MGKSFDKITKRCTILLPVPQNPESLAAQNKKVQVSGLGRADGLTKDFFQWTPNSRPSYNPLRCFPVFLLAQCWPGGPNENLPNFRKSCLLTKTCTPNLPFSLCWPSSSAGPTRTGDWANTTGPNSPGTPVPLGQVSVRAFEFFRCNGVKLQTADLRTDLLGRWTAGLSGDE